MWLRPPYSFCSQPWPDQLAASGWSLRSIGSDQAAGKWPKARISALPWLSFVDRLPLMSQYGGFFLETP